MNTRIIKVDPLQPKEDFLKEAAQIIKNGGLVIIPTETVYGIAANMLDNKAVEKLYQIKDRPQGKPFSLHIDIKEKAEEFAKDISIAAYKLMDKFWPGPLTLILESKDKGTIGASTSLECHGERSRTIGIRLPDNEIAQRIIAYAGVPVVCPSANLSAKPAPINFQDAIEGLKGRVDFAIDAGATKLGLESSVVDVTVKPLRILREGAIKREEIEATAAKKTVLFICTGNSCRSVMAKGLLEKKLKEDKRRDVEVLSAGIMMAGGLGATDEVKQLLRQEGMDVSAHRSQRVTKEMVKKSDIILVMEKLHEEKILELAPEVKNRLFLLKEFAKIDERDLNIDDPVGRPMDFYEKTFGVIKEAVERIIKII